METKRQLIFILTIMSLMITGILCGAVPDGDPPATTTISGLGWQSHTCLVKKVYMTPLEIKLDVGLDAAKKVGGTFSLNTEISMIDCCSSCDEEKSWCNFDGDHEGC